MDMKHTPGPWHVCRDGICSCKFIWSACGDVHVATAYYDQDLGADYYGSDRACNQETATANARLIAAAPELLEALERALNFIANTESELGITLESGAAARAAIAKATGQ